MLGYVGGCEECKAAEGRKQNAESRNRDAAAANAAAFAAVLGRFERRSAAAPGGANRLDRFRAGRAACARRCEAGQLGGTGAAGPAAGGISPGWKRQQVHAGRSASCRRGGAKKGRNRRHSSRRRAGDPHGIRQAEGNVQNRAGVGRLRYFKFCWSDSWRSDGDTALRCRFM